MITGPGNEGVMEKNLEEAGQKIPTYSYKIIKW